MITTIMLICSAVINMLIATFNFYLYRQVRQIEESNLLLYDELDRDVRNEIGLAKDQIKSEWQEIIKCRVKMDEYCEEVKGIRDSIKTNSNSSGVKDASLVDKKHHNRK